MSRNNKDKEVYRIIDKENGSHQGVYDRSYNNSYDFDSPCSARSANCHGIYKDWDKYKINKYKVTFTLIEEDCEDKWTLEMKEEKKERENDPVFISVKEEMDRQMDKMFSGMFSKKGNKEK